ncbi:MAG: hypothetical protein WBW88_05205 [Rhodothermales bacterium]
MRRIDVVLILTLFTPASAFSQTAEHVLPKRFDAGIERSIGFSGRVDTTNLLSELEAAHASRSLDASSAEPDPLDVYWFDRFGIPGAPIGVVRFAEADSSGNLYVAGDISLDGQEVTIARWDGHEWSPLLPGSGRVYDLRIGPSGELYVFGLFFNPLGTGPFGFGPIEWNGIEWASIPPPNGDLSYTGTVDRQGNLILIYPDRVFRKNGQIWTMLGPSFSGRLQIAAVNNDNQLYVGGDFDSVGTVEASNIAVWHDERWEPLGTGVHGGSVGQILADKTGGVFVAGGFTMAGDAEVIGMAHWTEGRWESLMADFEVSDFGKGSIWDLVVDDSGGLVVGGYFDRVNGTPASNLARWNGDVWDVVDGGPSTIVQALAFGSSLYVGGYFSKFGGIRSNSIAAWNSGVWSSVGSTAGNGIDGYPIAVIEDLDGTLIVAGSFESAGQTLLRNIARWNGSRWTPIGDRDFMQWDGYVESLAIDSAGAIYAGGSFGLTGGVAAANIAQWTGMHWQKLGKGVDRIEGDDPLLGVVVRDMAVDETNALYVVGSFSLAGGKPALNVAMWDGAKWNALGEGIGGSVNHIAVGKHGEVFVSASAALGSTQGGHIEKWDGREWAQFPTDGFEQIGSIATAADGTLFAVVGVDTVFGPYSVARWDGSTWTVLGGPVWDSIDALYIDRHGSLFVAGTKYHWSYGTPMSTVASWSGTDWIFFGSGFDSRADDITQALDGSVFVVGDILTAGGKLSTNIAEWTGPLNGVCNSTAQFDLKAFLEGPYSDGSMTLGAQYAATIPTSQPFSGAEFAGTDLEFDGDVSVASLPENAVDWVLVSLRADSSSGSEVARKPGFLLANGEIIDPAGGPLEFDSVEGGFHYVVVNQRNHIPVMSSELVDSCVKPAVWDFTTSASQAFGASAMKEVEPGVWALLAADANADGLVTALDFGAWLSGTTAGVTGYQQADFDLDGAVTATDFVLWLANTTAGAASRVPG